MKKQRLLSLLLAASLTASSLPMMATSIAAEDEIKVGENLISGLTASIAVGDTTGAKNTDSAVSGSQYLHVGNRDGSRATGLMYNTGVLDANTTYYISFYARASVPSGKILDVAKNDFWLRLEAGYENDYHTGSNKKFWVPTDKCSGSYSTKTTDVPQSIALTTEWKYFEMKFTSSTLNKGNNKIAIYAGADTRYRCGFDIDDFKFYTRDEDGKEKLISAMYEWKNDAKNKVSGGSSFYDFEGKSALGSGIGRFSANSSAKLTIETADEYYQFTPGENETEVVYSYVPTAGNELTLESGRDYKLTGEMRYGTFWADVLSDTDGKNGGDTPDYPWGNGKSYNGTDDDMIYTSAIDATVKVTIDETPDDTTDDDTVCTTALTANVDWTDFTVSVPALDNGGILKSIEITTTKKKIGNKDDSTAVNPDAPVAIKNLSFALASFVEEENVDTVPEENLIGNLEMTATGEIVNESGYLSVAERPKANGLFVLTLPEKAVANRTYYVSYDARVAESSTSGTTVIRPVYNGVISEASAGGWPEASTSGMSGNFLVPIYGTTATISWNNATEGVIYYPLRSFPNTNLTKEWDRVVYQFTPVANANSIVLTMSRGPSTDFKQPVDFDNVKVWYMNGNEEVVVYENAFYESAVPEFTSAVALEVKNSTTSVAAVADTDTVVTYNAADLDSYAGTYDFSTSVMTTDGTSGNAWVEVVLSSGVTKTSDPVAINGSAYTDLAYSIYLADGVSIASVKIVTDFTCGIKFTAPSLTFVPDAEGKGMPNIGIIMMMLLKKQGGASARPVKTEFIENGDFEQAVTIVDGIAAKSQTAANAGWYAKMADDQETVVSYETEGDNHFVRVSNLNTNQRGVWYNTGVTLEPGTYTLTADMRVSEGSDHPNYTAKEWRDAAKNTMQVRINLQNPASINSTYYQAFNPVDKDTFMNDSGNAVGTLITVNREWTKYTDTVVVEQPTLVILKIGGGTGADKDSHGFDIDNLSIVGYVTPVVEGGEDKTEPEFVSLIPNGNFATAPEVVKEGYDATKPAWYANAKMDYKYDNKGKAIETEPQFYHDHNVTWNEEGYVTLTGKAFNLAKMYYNPGVTLEAGSYVLSYDAKCANKGETTSIRLYTAPVATDKAYQAATAVTLTDAWATFTYEFTVTEAGGMRISIYGGPGASYLHDICLDNLVLTKK